ncbi:MAG: methyltransferase domain-containing protein [Actinomycetota bacterium]|nr:methyltransferase domain-containing protein [Actinomycetota bacterium]
MIEANPSDTLGRWRGAGDGLASFDDDISGLGRVRKRSKGLIAGGALAGLAAVLGYAVWWRKNPSACPYAQRFWVEMPHPFITKARLREALAPEPGERVLEVGPGTGYYALEVAGWLVEGTPHGRLDVFDLQQEMLDHVMRRAKDRDLTNITPTRGDARALPYPDGSFDAAYLAVVLGEIPDQEAALRELRRVLKPGGRLVVGEILVDPHVVTFGTLRRRAEAAGLLFERRLGGRLGFFACFRAR